MYKRQGLEYAKSQRAVENREKWRRVVVKSSVVLQRVPPLRDEEEEGVNLTSTVST